MLGVLRRRWKPKRNNGGRKTKDKDSKCTPDGNNDLSASPRESRTSRAVRDTRQVHPEKESDKIGVLGRDYPLLSSAGQKDTKIDPVKEAILSPAQLLKEFQKDCLLSPPPQSPISKKSSSYKDVRDHELTGSEGHAKSDAGVKHIREPNAKGWSEKIIRDDVDDGVSKDESPVNKQDKEFDLNSSTDNASLDRDNHSNELCIHKDDDSNELCEDSEYLDAQKSSDDESAEKSTESEGEKEKMDAVKDSLEAQVAELKRQLEEQKEQLKKEQAALAQLKLETSSQGRLREDLERERLLRIDAEARLREVRLECEHCKARAANLQEDFRKMEDMVCNMLQFKLRIDQLKHERSSLALAYENQIRKYESCIETLEKENYLLMNELKTLEATNKEREEEHERSLSLILMERMKLLEQENASLMVENEQQRLQYERCLDDVANQVVQALLAQKNLKEECLKLQRKVQDLEHQNRALTTMFKQRFLHTADCAVSCSNKERMQHSWLSHDPKSPEDDFGQDFSGLGNTQCKSPLGNSGLRNCPSSGQRNQQPGQDSPEPTSQSEDSTESLASMCSDYSFNSGSSGGNLMSQPGLPKMSSPPQWLRDRLNNASGDVPPATLASKLLLTGIQHRYYHTPSKWGSSAGSGSRPKLKMPWSELLGRAATEQDPYSKDEMSRGFLLLGGEQTERNVGDVMHCRSAADVPSSGHTRKVGTCLETNPHQVRHRNVDRIFTQDKDFASSRSTGIDSLNGLDDVETPSDECFSLDGLPILGASQKHFSAKDSSRCASDKKGSQMASTPDPNCSFADPLLRNTSVKTSVRLPHQVPSSSDVDESTLGKRIANLPNVSGYSCNASMVHDSQVATAAVAATTSNLARSGLNASRPTTLNVIPHMMGDPVRNFCFPSLEVKSHVTNPCGNVYEDLEKPHFPAGEDVVNPSKSHGAFLRDDLNTVISKRKETQKQSQKNTTTSTSGEEFLSSTVLRKLPGSQVMVTKPEESSQSASHAVSQSKHNTVVNKTSYPIMEGQSSSCVLKRQPEHCHPSSCSALQSAQNMCRTYHESTHLEISSPVLENESPLSVGDVVEHGNKDEGYSTMSSDVQSDLVAISGACGSIHDLPSSQQHSPICIPVVEMTCNKDHPARQEMHEGCMTSSSDSGLGIHRCSVRSKQASDEVDTWSTSGVASDPNGSVIRRDANGSVQKSLTTVSEVKNDDSAESKSDDQLTQSSSLGDASVETQVTTINVSESQTLEDLVDSLGLKNQRCLSTDPSYDKFLLLLAPQGFKPRRRESRRVTLPLVHTPVSNQVSSYLTARRVETAEKATITDLEEKSSCNTVPRKMHDASTLADGIEEKRMEAEAETMCNLISDSFAFQGASDEHELFPCHACSTYHKNSHILCEDQTVVKGHTKLEPSDCKNALCLRRESCSQWPQRRSMFLLPSTRDTEEVQLLQRASSDSRLFLRSVVHSRQCSRCTSFLTSMELRHTEVNLGLLPLEVHNSACELSSHSLANSTTITPPLRRSKRQILVEHPDPPMQWLEPDGGPHSPTVSLSSVRTSVSEEGSPEDDEELGAISLKCSRDRDISSDSGDEHELLEHHNLVEKWLQGGSDLHQEQRPHSYDEEEVGNWSFQLIREDEPSSTPKKTDVWQDQWSSDSKSSSVHCRRNLPSRELERIEEAGLEDDYQDDFWGGSYWNVKKTSEPEAETTKEEGDEKKENEPEDIPLPVVDASANVGSPACDDMNRPKEESSVKSTDDDVTVNYDNPVEDSHDTAKEFDDVLKQIENVGKSTEDLVTLETEKNVNVIPEIMSMSDSSCSGGHLNAETKEFKRDFYRLCSVGSSKSLVVSESESTADQEALHQSPSPPIVSSLSCNANLLCETLVSITALSEPKLQDEGCNNREEKSVPIEMLLQTESSTEPATLPGIVSVTTTTSSTPQQDKELRKAKRLRSPSVQSVSDHVAMVEGAEKANLTDSPETPSIRKKERRTRKSSLGSQSNVTVFISEPSGMVAGIEKTKIPVSMQSAISGKPRKHSHHRSSSAKASSTQCDGIKRKVHKEDRSQSSVSQRLPEKHKELRERSSKKTNSQAHDQSNVKKVVDNREANISVKVSSKSSNKVSSSSKKHSASQEQRKLPKAEKTEENKKQEMAELTVEDLEKKLLEKGEMMSVADKIHELNAFLSRSKMALQLPDASKCDSVVATAMDNSEAHDSSLERRKTIQKKEKALREGNGSKEGCGTSWVHLEADIDLSDPKARANLLDSMMASSSSSGSEDEDGDGDIIEHQYHQRLHAIHRIRRHKKRATDRDAVISFIPRIRASIIDRQDFYCRFGEKEKEAVACFDFLEELSTSPSDGDPCEGPQVEAAASSQSESTLVTTVPTTTTTTTIATNDNNNPVPIALNNNASSIVTREMVVANSPSTGRVIVADTIEANQSQRYSLDESVLHATTVANCRISDDSCLFSTTTSFSQEGADTVDHISLSDSCAESYTSSTQSLNHIN